MKKIVFLLLLLFFVDCKKKANGSFFMLGFLGILSQEPPVEVTVGGTVSGVRGTGLVLQNNGGDDLPISADGTFQFPSVILEGASYNVTVKTQPSNPFQTCVVAGGIGQALKSPITSITVNCSTNKYTIGGVVSGLASTGLSLTNGTDTVTIASNGTFAFPTTVESGAAYNVTMTPATGIIGGTNQPLQNCTLTNGGGVVAGTAISNISVSCITQTVQLTVTAAGITNGTLVVQNNGTDITLTHTAPSVQVNIPSGSAYNVTIKSQPSLPGSAQAEVCTNLAGSGVAFANTTVNINCTDATTILAAVTGLAGSGLILQNNNADNLTVGSNGTVAFATPMVSGNYNVSVASQPKNPWQTCIASSNTGTASGASVTANVSCTTNKYSIGGSITGLANGNSITLQLSGGTNGGTAAANATKTNLNATSFEFSQNTELRDSGSTGVTLSITAASLSSPPQVCRMSYNGTSVSTASTLPIQVTIPIQGSNISDVVINCSNLYSVSGIVTGLDTNSSGLSLALNGSILTTVNPGDTSFSFPVPAGLLASGDNYAVTVQTQPTPGTGGKWQDCAVSLGTGTITQDVTNVVVACTTATYTIGGKIVGLTGTGLTIQHVSNDNSPTISETMVIDPGTTTFTFPTPQQSGSTYTISISAPAVGQVCRVLNPTGTVLGGAKSTLTDSSGTSLNTSGTTVDPNITSIIINCEAGAMISGTISNYVGNGLRIRKLYTTGGTAPAVSDESIWINSNGTFAFPHLGTANQNYTILILNQPWGPTQTCEIKDTDETTANQTSITSTIAATPVDITDIKINCKTNTYNLSVTIANYVSPIATGLKIKNNTTGFESATINLGTTSVNMDTNIESGKTFDMVVSAQPSGHNCIVFNGQGTVWGSGALNVVVNCEPKYNEVVSYEWSVRGYYRLGEASGPFADSIPTAANASVSSADAVKYVSLGLIAGDTNASAFFTGSGYIEAATTTKFDFTNHLSLEAWIVPYSLTGTIIDKGSNYSLRLNSGKVQLCIAGTCVDSTATLSLGKRYHIAVTHYNGTNGTRIFINGVRDSSHTSSASPAPDTSAKLRIGANSLGTSSFTGVIDDVSIYRYNLVDQTIALHYRWGARLTAEYNFAGVLTDSSTFSNTLTASGTPATVTDEDGLANGAYSFNGTNQYMSIPSGISTPYTQNFLTNKITLSAWVNLTAPTSGVKSIFYNGDASSGYGLRINASGQLEAVSGTNAATGNSVLTANKWFHVAAVRASNTWTLYVNGKSETVTNATATVTAPAASGSTFAIGVDSTLAANFTSGKISRIKLFHAALSAAEIRNLAIQVPTGILSYYPFNTGSGEDTGFIGNTGTYANLGNDRFSIASSAGTFNGSQSFTLTPVGFGNSSGSPRTLCAFVKWDSLPAPGQTQTILEYTGLVGLSITNTGGQFSLNIEGTSADIPTPDVTNWFHFCASKDTGGYTLYRNGTALINSATTLNATGVVASLRIGSNIAGANFFNGSIDDIRIYNRVLSASEIQALSGN
jgi:hypothetical protein